MESRQSQEIRKVDLPFKVVHNSRKTLVDQVTDGLRTCILSGHYAAGDVLPTIRGLAVRLGVSDIVTRAAIRRLAEEDLVIPRPKLGIQVLGRGGKTWKGRILLVTRSNGRTYYVNVFTAALREKLVKAGWELAQATVGLAAKPDVSELELQLAHPTDLAIVMFENPAAERLLSRSKVPFVFIGNADRKSNAAIARIEICRSAASKAFAAACRRSGARSAMEVGCERFSDVGVALRDVGVSVVQQAIGLPRSGPMPESLVRAAHEAFTRFLADPAWRRTDLIYFSDDYLCRGALVALMQAGVRIPEDVRVASWTNRGNAPVYARELSRLEMDPEMDAEKAAEVCLSAVAGTGVSKHLQLEPTFVPGETI